MKKAKKPHGGRRSNAGRTGFAPSADDCSAILEIMRRANTKAEHGSITQAVRRHSLKHRWLVGQREVFLNTPAAQREPVEHYVARLDAALGSQFRTPAGEDFNLLGPSKNKRRISVMPKRAYGLSTALQKWVIGEVRKATGKTMSFDTIKRINSKELRKIKTRLDNDPIAIAARELGLMD